MDKSSKIAICIIAVFSIVLAWGWIIAAREIDQLREDLSNRGVTTIGMISEIKPGVKGKKVFMYSFQASNHEYYGKFNANRNSFQIGDSVKLKYDPLDPSRNERIRPASITSTTKGKLIVAAYLLVPILFSIGYVIYIFKKNPPDKE
ncbi:MAG: hypothetical protein HDS72_04845 [Bacteroidales bacterium]|nr:hypothetical protein [Bacteroidales bacterium]